MRYPILDLAILTAVVLGHSLAADSNAVIAIDPIRTVTVEHGVVPSGTSLIVRMKDVVKTRNASRGTLYFASTATDVLDENGAVLIPRESPVELVVRSMPYLGPGGGAMTLLALDIDTIVVRDVHYPVETDNERPGPGGIGVNRGGARWIGGSDNAAGHVITRGQSINVPVGALLAFRVQAPIRLQGYQR